MAEKQAEKLATGTLTGRAFYAFLNKPQHDKENNKEVYKIDLCLVNEAGQPIVVLDKKTGQKINMLERAKSYGLIIKDETKTIPGPWVRIKREKKEKTDDEGNTVITKAPEVKGKGGINFGDKIVGNESLVQVEFTIIPIRQGAYKGKNNTSYLNKVVVHQLVEYVSSMDEEELEFDMGDVETAKVATPKLGTVTSDEIEELE